MQLESERGGFGQQPGVARAVGIKQDDEAHLLALAFELLRHLERNQTAEGSPTQMVRATRLQRADLADVVRGHIFHTRVKRLLSIESLCLQPVERLVGTEAVRQIAIEEHIAAGRVDAEEGRARALRVQRHE
jgi:hypothetical protein